MNLTELLNCTELISQTELVKLTELVNWVELVNYIELVKILTKCWSKVNLRKVQTFSECSLRINTHPVTKLLKANSGIVVKVVNDRFVHPAATIL